jgi:crotonobetainyl-CoA:carnitine CoA-transferase CaiB-like acyl-CoA transferase
VYKKDLLVGVKVLDLTQRLPGPFTTKILSNLGAEVTKLSPLGKKDAFLTQGKVDSLFLVWYNNLNENKELEEVDFNSRLQAYIDESDLIVYPKGFKKDLFDFSNKAILIVAGGKKNTSMHDLNALASTKAFHLFTHNKKDKKVDPPYLPFAGIAFSQQMATEAVASIFKSKMQRVQVETTVYLDESVKFIFDHFWNIDIEKENRFKFLHNGRFPSYNLYRTKDDLYVAIAAVEEHFWIKFCEIFNLPLKKEDRFDTSGTVFNELINMFGKLTLGEIVHKIGDQDICLTPVE